MTLIRYPAYGANFALLAERGKYLIESIFQFHLFMPHFALGVNGEVTNCKELNVRMLRNSLCKWIPYC